MVFLATLAICTTIGYFRRVASRVASAAKFGADAYQPSGQGAAIVGATISGAICAVIITAAAGFFF
jgi:hypothetical protein